MQSSMTTYDYQSKNTQGAYLANICHDMRTPLNSIFCISQMLRNPLFNMQKQKQCIEILGDSTKMLYDLIDNFVNCSQVESGMVALDNKPLDITAVIQEVIHIVTPKAEEKNIHLDINIQKIPKVMGDSLRVRQIILNLLSNAVKFTNSGEISLKAWSVQNINKDWNIHISVTDTGIGIAPEWLEKVFNKYTQAGASINQTYGGNGLGLTICRDLARMMNGDIQVESTLGQGSCFNVLLKLPEAF